MIRSYEHDGKYWLFTTNGKHTEITLWEFKISKL